DFHVTGVQTCALPISDKELSRSRRDILIGMTFSNLVMYFIILSTGSTLYAAGQHDISTATQAAEALRPLAGEAASALFTLGLIRSEERRVGKEGGSRG